MRSVLNFTKCIRRMAASANLRTWGLLRTFGVSSVMQRDTDTCRTSWDPLQIFDCSSQHKYALIILNRPILWNHGTVLRIWEKAQVTFTVDGGTHRWLKYLDDNSIDVMDGEHNQFIPDFITGDMDSCSPVVLEQLKAMGATIVKTPDQNLTDYTKALHQLGQYIKIENINLDTVYVFAETSGRFDHIMGNINTLFQSEKYIRNVKVIHVSSNSLTWLLRPGLHSIAIPKILVDKQEWCGLLPFGFPVKHITTTGLKWNLNNAIMQFGGLISSSNTYGECTEVTVETDSPVIWTMGIEPLVECFHHSEAS